MATAPPVPQIVTRGDMAGNVISFARHLRAANLTPATQRTYLDSLDRLAHFLEASGMPTDVSAMRREHLEAFIEDQLARWKPTTAANRYSGIRPFFAWLVDEGEIKVNPMAKMRKPKLPEHAPPIPSDTDVERLLAASSGQDFVERRDTAILRTFLATGARLSEVAGLRYTPRNPATNDVDLDLGIIRIISGKGRRERISYLSAKAVKAIDVSREDQVLLGRPPRGRLPGFAWTGRDASTDREPRRRRTCRAIRTALGAPSHRPSASRLESAGSDARGGTRQTDH